MAKEDKVVEEGKLCAILAYLLIGIIWYFADEKMKKNGFAKFHAKQGLNFLVISLALGIIWSILSSTIVLIPVVVIIAPIVNIILLIIWIIAVINVINGKTKDVPLVGKFAEKYLTF